MGTTKKFPRRRFLQGLAVSPVVLTAGGLTAAQADEAPLVDFKKRRVPVLQNWTDETSALVTVLGNAGWKFAPAEGSPLAITVNHTRNIVNTTRVLYELSIQGLSPDTFRAFTIANRNGNIIETRTLKGLDLARKKPRIAVMSCSNYRKIAEQARIWSRVQEQQIDLILFIGDIVYSNSQLGSIFRDPEPPESALDRYIQTWDLVDLYQQEPLVPLVAVWDDHDYGQNNGDAANPYRDTMKEIFRAFYPLPAQHERLSSGPGVAFRFTAFGIDIHMLDDRSFFDGDEQWGREQEKWLHREYKASANPAWLINGIQYFDYFRFSESTERKAPGSLERLKNLLRRNRKPTVLFSGDVHASQVQEIRKDVFGYPTYELTSSAVHSLSAGSWLERSPDDGQLHYYGDNNFLIVTPDADANRMELRIHCATTTEVQDWGRVTIQA